ncbi:MAG: hypothetical protein ABSE39_02050 [Candidatus Bathyarchaeia archaeon]
MTKLGNSVGRRIRWLFSHAYHNVMCESESAPTEGQINRQSRFGEIISSVAKDSRFQTFLEIGTWNGQGSTRCFIDALLGRDDDYLFISLENDRGLYACATKHWKGKINDKIQLVYGTVVRPDEIMKEEEIRAHPLFGSQMAKDHYYLHYQSDVDNSGTAPLVIERIPSKIDVLLLDGGEFSGYAEWSKLRHRGLKVVLLDDINTMKNSTVFEELRQDGGWNVALEDRGDRNGIAVFVRSGESVRL